MPIWLTAPLIVAVALLIGWWAETRVTSMIVELKAIRGDLDKLWAKQSKENAETRSPQPEAK